MEFDIPDELVRRAETNATELRLLLAIQLYADNRIDHLDACLLAQMPPQALNRELLDRQISIQEYPRQVREAG